MPLGIRRVVVARRRAILSGRAALLLVGVPLLPALLLVGMPLLLICAHKAAGHAWVREWIAWR